LAAKINYADIFSSCMAGFSFYENEKNTARLFSPFHGKSFPLNGQIPYGKMNLPS